MLVPLLRNRPPQESPSLIGLRITHKEITHVRFSSELEQYIEHALPVRHPTQEATDPLRIGSFSTRSCVGLAQITDFCPFGLSGLQSHSLPVIGIGIKSWPEISCVHVRIEISDVNVHWSMVVRVHKNLQTQHFRKWPCNPEVRAGTIEDKIERVFRCGGRYVGKIHAGTQEFSRFRSICKRRGRQP
jgi:hypothetical protein